MRKLTDDFDPRLLIMPVEAWYKVRSQRDPINGILILTTVGVHFYGQRFDSVHKTFVDIEPEHVAIHDVEFSTSNWSSAPVLKVAVYNKTNPGQRTYNVGFTKTIGRGNFGEMFAGIGNMSKHVATGDKRADFISAVADVKKRAPSLGQFYQGTNVYKSRFLYFAETSAFAPALLFADMSIGVPDVRRKRAWLLFNGQHIQQLLAECQDGLEWDPEVMIVHALTHAITGSREKAIGLIKRAQQTTSDNIRIRAAEAWSKAMVGMRSESQAIIADLHSQATSDQQTLFLLGCASELNGEHSLALEYYLASATLVTGYIEGAAVTKRVLLLSNAQNAHDGLSVMRQLTQAVPNQREAWKGLALAAKRASDTTVAREAQERLTAMESAAL